MNEFSAVSANKFDPVNLAELEAVEGGRECGLWMTNGNLGYSCKATTVAEVVEDFVRGCTDAYNRLK